MSRKGSIEGLFLPKIYAGHESDNNVKGIGLNATKNKKNLYNSIDYGNIPPQPINDNIVAQEQVWHSDADHLKGDDDLELVVKVLRAKQREEMMQAIKEEEK